MDDKKSCKTCWWCSRGGYCTKGGRPQNKCKEPCEKYKPLNKNSSK